MSQKPVKTSLISKVRRFIEQRALLRPGDTIVVAVSGGIDSRVLLEVLYRLSLSWSLNLVIAHLNHRLRGPESDRDEAFVQGLGSRMGLPVVIDHAPDLKHLTQGGKSLQVVARAHRYRFFEQVRLHYGAQRIALGHTRSDQAETVLMRLVRGSGAGGLAGMPVVRDGGIIRPLLATSRAEIESFARAEGLEWVEDSSNGTPVYTRNRVRLELLPVLTRLNPRIEMALAQLAETARREDAYLTQVVDRICTSEWIVMEEGRISIERDPFLEVHPALRYRLIRELASRLEGFRGEPSQLEQVHLAEGMSLIEEEKGTRQAHWPGGLTLTVTPTRIKLDRNRLEPLTERGAFLLEVPGHVRLPDGAVLRADLSTVRQFREAAADRRVCWLDAATLELPLRIRFPERGDRFHPLGAPAPTRLSEFFIRQKLPKSERFRTPLVLSGEQIVWIPGVRSAEPGKLTSATNDVVRLEFVRGSSSDVPEYPEID